MSKEAKRRCIEKELSYSFMRNFWSRAVGNKTDPIDYLEHPVPLLWGEFGKQDLFVSKGGPLGGLGYRHFSNFMMVAT